MNIDLLSALIIISNILVEQYNLTIEETVECITSYRDYSALNDMEACKMFLHTDYRTWAKRMYEKYNVIRAIPLTANGSVCGEEPWNSSNFEQEGPSLKRNFE